MNQGPTERIGAEPGPVASQFFHTQGLLRRADGFLISCFGGLGLRAWSLGFRT